MVVVPCGASFMEGANVGSGVCGVQGVQYVQWHAAGQCGAG